MQVKVCFDGDCYVVHAVQDPVDAEHFDATATIRSAERERRLRHPLKEALDQESVKITLQRFVAEPDES